MSQLLGVLDALPLTPGPFVQAPAMLPFRPVLHWWNGELAVHTVRVKEDGSTFLDMGNYYPMVRKGEPLTPESNSMAVAAMTDYQERCTNYFRHLRLVLLRQDEGGMGVLNGE
jgi:hypothetical protein